MKKLIEILIFAFALAAFVSCEKEPDPIPEPPITLSKFIIGTWDEIPANPTKVSYYSVTFTGKYYSCSHTDEDGDTHYGDPETYVVGDNEIVFTPTVIRNYKTGTLGSWPFGQVVVTWSESVPDQMTLTKLNGQPTLFNRKN